jgi:hypothetical protein
MVPYRPLRVNQSLNQSLNLDTYYRMWESMKDRNRFSYLSVSANSQSGGGKDLTSNNLI